MKYGDFMAILDKKTPTVKQLAKKYDVEISAVEKELAKGIKVELEHTSDKEVAKEIALDHLSERLDYYKMLQRMEKTAEMNEEDAGRLLQQGYTIINEAVSGRYHLFLIRQPRMIAQATGAEYQLGFNKEIEGEQTSITENAYRPVDRQVKTLELGAETMPIIPKELFTVLDGWVQEYGNIVAAAGSNELTEKYKRILIKLLNGVDVTTRNLQGKSFVILSPAKTKTSKLKIKVAEPRGLNKPTPGGEVDRPLHRKTIRFVTIGEVLEYVVKTEDWDEKEMEIVTNNLLDRLKYMLGVIHKMHQADEPTMLPLDSTEQLLQAMARNTSQLAQADIDDESTLGEFIETLDVLLPRLRSDLEALGVEYVYITPMLQKIQLPAMPELRMRNKQFLTEQVRDFIPMNQQTLGEDNLDFLPGPAQPALTTGRPPQEVGYTPPKKQKETVTFKPQHFDCIELENALSILIDNPETFEEIMTKVNPHKRAGGNPMMAEQLRQMGSQMGLDPRETEAFFGLNFFLPVERGLARVVASMARFPGIIPPGSAGAKRFKRLLERIEALGVPYLNMTQ